MEKISHERLTHLLHYDPDTGIFTWKDISGERPMGGKLPGSIAGCLHQHNSGNTKNLRPLILIGVEYRLYRAHRLAWFYVHKEWPKSSIDHINGDPIDNRNPRMLQKALGNLFIRTNRG